MPNKNKRRIFRILIVSFIVSFVLLVVVSLYALRQINVNNAFSAQVDHTNVVISEMYQLDILVRDLDIKEQNYMLTGDSVFIEKISEQKKEIHASTQRLKGLISANKQQLKLITQLRSLIILRLDAVENNLKHYDKSTPQHLPFEFYKGKELKQQLLRYITAMQKNEYEFLLERYKQKKNSEKIAQSVVQTLIISFFVITLFLFLILIREIYIRRNFQDQLQKRVIDLKQSNEELEQITYALSHDVQEPLRKIQIFSNRLFYLKGNREQTMEVAQRLNRNARSVQTLLEDMDVLLGLRKDQYEERVSLNEILDAVLSDMRQQVQDKKATIRAEQLPTIKGNYKQLQLLFRNLIDNALKFARENEQPVIAIRCNTITDEQANAVFTNEGIAYFRMTVEDNGIGFNNTYAEKIFKIFQRLHDNEAYSGKGIGLAICRRIVNNHNGVIKADGNPDKGAIFTLYFPKN